MKICFLIFSVIFIQFKSTCTPLKGDSETELNRELKKLGVSMERLNVVVPAHTYKGFKIYNNSEYNKEKIVQFMKFSLKKKELQKSFEFRQRFFKEPSVIEYFPFVTHCFQSPTKGYLLFLKKKEYKKYNEDNREDKSVETRMKFLKNLTKIYIKYEKENIKMIYLNGNDLGFNPSDETVPYILNANIFYESNDKMYKINFKNSISIVNDPKNAIIAELYTKGRIENLGETIIIHQEGTAPMIWNAFSFILSMVAATSNFSLFKQKEQPILNNPIETIFMVFNRYYEEYRNREREIISSEEMRDILEMLNMVEKEIAVKKFPSGRVLKQTARYISI